MRAFKPAVVAISVVSAGIGMYTSHARTSADSKNPIAVHIAPVSTQAMSASTARVKIDNFRFEPKELAVSVGTKVTWQNGDDVPHTATTSDAPQSFDSGPLDTDDSFSFTFTKPGKYAYFCKVHPHMTGVVIVK